MIVGSSMRSAAKLAMLRELVLSELHIVQARKRVPYRGHLLVDLTAGDAAGAGSDNWWRSSSPAIFAYAAAKFRQVHVRLWEKEGAIFEQLIANLYRVLPRMDFVVRKHGPWNWEHTCTGSTIEAFQGDSRVLEDFADMRRWRHLLVFNDPNTVNQWALNMQFFGQAHGTISFIASMGCNSHALKRAVPLENRSQWFERLEETISLVRGRQKYDLRLLRVVGDEHQWAYLVMLPANRMIRHASTMLEYSWRRDTREFERQISQLFYNKSERDNGHRWQAEPLGDPASAGASAGNSVCGG